MCKLNKYKWDILFGLLPFVQIKKNENLPWRSFSFIKVADGRRLPKKGDLDSLQIYDGAWQKGREWCFWGGEGIWYPMHTMVNYLTLCSILKMLTLGGKCLLCYFSASSKKVFSFLLNSLKLKVVFVNH